MPKTRRESTAHQVATERLRASILSGESLPGERLIQEALAEKYGLSRIPVREALRALEAEGLVVHGPGSGYTVAKIDAEMLHSIQRIRQLLEAEAVARAAMRGRLDASLAARMAVCLEKMEAVAPRDSAAIAALTRDFHFELFDACEDPIILRILKNLWDSTDSWRTIYYRLIFSTDPEHRQRAYETQRKLIAAVAKAEVATVVSILDDLRDRGIAAVETAVLGHKNETRWQAHLLLQALQA